jgi:hypothetical protein
MWLSPKIFPERLWHRNSIARLRTSTSRGALKHLCARAARGLDHHTSCSQSCITAQDTKRQDHVHKCLSIIRCFPEPFKTKRISLARRVSRSELVRPTTASYTWMDCQYNKTCRTEQLVRDWLAQLTGRRMKEGPGKTKAAERSEDELSMQNGIKTQCDIPARHRPCRSGVFVADVGRLLRVAQPRMESKGLEWRTD